MYGLLGERWVAMEMTDDELFVVTPADWVAGPSQGSWTYEDYAMIQDDGNRYEIVNGVLLRVPVPDPEHQEIVGAISYYLLKHVKLASLGRVFMAPLDVELSPKNTFQPDVVVILNAHLNRVAEKRIIGAPDLVVEVGSPSTAMYDRLNKYEKYAQAGVPEYWIAKTMSRTVEVMVLEGREYRSLGIFRGEQTLPSRIVPHLPVAVEQFFV